MSELGFEDFSISSFQSLLICREGVSGEKGWSPTDGRNSQSLKVLGSGHSVQTGKAQGFRRPYSRDEICTGFVGFRSLFCYHVLGSQEGQKGFSDPRRVPLGFCYQPSSKGFVSGVLWAWARTWQRPLGVKGFVSVGTDLPNAARTKPNQRDQELLLLGSRVLGTIPRN